MGAEFQLRVVNSTVLTITKKFRREEPFLWAAEPGPLKIVAINTGAGLVRLSPEEGGVLVAVVQADLHRPDGIGHGAITVQSSETQFVHQSTRQIKVAGSGFQDHIKVRFANAIRGEGTNFTIAADTRYPDQIVLNLAEGSTRIKDPHSLPKSLVMLAADAGRGWMPLGSTAAKQGRRVATVFEDPGIDTSDVEINRNTRELLIAGNGFNKFCRPMIQFDPPLNFHEIVVDMLNRTMIRLSLITASAEWTAVEHPGGPLNIKGVDTGAGLVVFDSPVTVATFAASVTASEESAV